jgi:hypothetical protein
MISALDPTAMSPDAIRSELASLLAMAHRRLRLRRAQDDSERPRTVPRPVPGPHAARGRGAASGFVRESFQGSLSRAVHCLLSSRGSSVHATAGRGGRHVPGASGWSTTVKARTDAAAHARAIARRNARRLYDLAPAKTLRAALRRLGDQGFPEDAEERRARRVLGDVRFEQLMVREWMRLLRTRRGGRS